MDSLSHRSQHEKHGRLTLMQPRRLLHIEASGAEVAIQYELIAHIGHFAELIPLKDGDVVLERVAVFNGSIIPVIDIRDNTKRSFGPVKDVAYQDLLVISLHGQLIGVRVEKVIDLLLVPPMNIEPLRTGLRDSAEFIIAMVCLPQQRLPLVDMNKLLYPDPGLLCSGREPH